MSDGDVPYSNFSLEAPGTSEAATCYAYPGDLVTERFRRLFNEIARLRSMLSEDQHDG